MTIIHIVSFLVIAITAGYLFRVTLGDMLPFVWCGLILVLYVLAFGRFLNFIDVIMPILAVFLLVYLLIIRKEIHGLLSYTKDNVLSGSFLVYLVFLIALPIFLNQKIVTWWDDINYWASDLKSLYYLNGFANKYANVSPAFGDYPPGVQLAKWYGVHMNPHEFRESLAFVGYYLFNFSFVMPLYQNIKGKKIWLVIPLTIVTWFLPGVAEIYGYAGFCADLSMAMMFGSVLIYCFDKHADSALFDDIRVMLVLAVLVITKSTGPVWTLFGLTIWVIVRFLEKKKIITSLYVCVAPFMTGASWLGFCILRHRITQTTSTMVTYITTDKYGLSEYTGQFAKAFAKAFFTEPVHVGHVGIMIPPAVMLVLVVAACFLLYKKGYMDASRVWGKTKDNECPNDDHDGQLPETGIFITIALPIMGVIYYTFIFICHITIFGTESQYLEPTAMIASIERYGAPFMLGSILLISWLWLNGKRIESEDEEKLNYTYRIIIFMAAVLFLTNIPAAFDGIYDYRETLASDMEIREKFIDESSRIFLDEIKTKIPEGNLRVCRVRDGGYYRVKDTYVAYEASPVSVISISYDLNQIDESSLVYAINQTHASLLYVDKPTDAESGETAIYDTYLNGWARSADGTEDAFHFEQLYFISYEDGGVVLYPVE